MWAWIVLAVGLVLLIVIVVVVVVIVKKRTDGKYVLNRAAELQVANPVYGGAGSEATAPISFDNKDIDPSSYVVGPVDKS